MPLKRNTGLPLTALATTSGASVSSASTASFPLPDWSAQIVIAPLRLVVTPAPAFSQTLSPVSTGLVGAEPVMLTNTGDEVVGWPALSVATTVKVITPV